MMYTTYSIALALVLCLILSFMLSGMEAGVFALNRLRVRRLARSGSVQAQRLRDFLEKPERFLWTIFIGNTLVNFVIFGWFFTKLHEWFAGHEAWIAALFVAFVFVFYSFSDLLPKMLYRAYSDRLCLASAGILRFVHAILSPLVLTVEGISRLALAWRRSQAFTGRLFGNREEMRAVMAEAAQALTSEEYAMVNRVLDLQHFTVAKIAVPMERTFAADARTPLAEALLLARGKNLSRLPVWETRDGKRRIAGIMDMSALLFEENLDLRKTAGEFISPAVFLHDDTRLEIALRRMQRAGQRLAVVLARDGRETGVVALGDILNLMFGEVKL
jgi:CBS domain containing-hemolysin-like protein